MNISRALINVHHMNDENLITTLKDLPGVKKVTLKDGSGLDIVYDSELVSRTDLEESVSLFFALK